jgi:hypothetical protein
MGALGVMGYRVGCVVGFHSRASLCASAICAGVIWRHAPCDVVSIFYRILVALRRRQVEPRVRA